MIRFEIDIKSKYSNNFLFKQVKKWDQNVSSAKIFFYLKSNLRN